MFNDSPKAPGPFALRLLYELHVILPYICMSAFTYIKSIKVTQRELPLFLILSERSIF